jgi:serine/threonine-protein kinase haspin
MGSTVEDKVGEESLLKACEQREIIPMSQLFKDVTNLEKIGEGIFGECYQGMVPRDAKDSKGQGDQRLKVVFKVLPIQGTALVNGEKQKMFGEVEPEVVISG